MEHPISKIGDRLADLLSSKEVLAALLGAFVGGLMTYWAVSYEERRKQRNVELSLSSLVMLEILRNLAGIEFALDRVLPLWLQRKSDGYKPGFSLNYSLTNTSRLASKIYDQYFMTLAATKLGILLLTHYYRQEDYNYWASKQPVTIPADSLQGYVRSLALLMEGGIDLVDRLRAMKGMSRFIIDHRLEFEDFDYAKQRRKLRAALFRTDEHEVRDIINHRSVRKGVPKELLEAPSNQLREWIAETPPDLSSRT